MEVHFVDSSEQNENTLNPQLINGEVKHWKTTRRVSRYKKLSEHIKAYKELRPYIKELFIYDVEGILGILCDQDCKLGGKSGCFAGMNENKYDSKHYGIIINSFEVIDEEAREKYNN